jgi:UPF0716 protein FxsA
MPWLFLILFLAIPATEIYLFVAVGGWVGAGPTVLLTFATAVIGVFLARAQGIAVLRRAQASVDRGEAPVQEALDGLALFVAGVLLVIPGFFTDAVGALLLLPIVRQAIGIAAMTKLLTMRVRTTSYGGPEDVVEGDFEVVHPGPDDPAGRSPAGSGQSDRILPDKSSDGRQSP